MPKAGIRKSQKLQYKSRRDLTRLARATCNCGHCCPQTDKRSRATAWLRLRLSILNRPGRPSWPPVFQVMKPGRQDLCTSRTSSPLEMMRDARDHSVIGEKCIAIRSVVLDLGNARRAIAIERPRSV